MKRPTQILIKKGETRFRREVLLQAQQLLVAIDHSEDELELYKRQDQPAYHEWIEENFGEKVHKLNELEQQYAEAIRFHNWIVAESRMQRSSMATAFRAIQAEAVRFAEGDRSVRETIESRRREREDFINQECGPDQLTAEPVMFAPPLPPNAETLKCVYRKLVRRLHPDMLIHENDSAELRWQKKVWAAAQNARRDGQLERLELLYRVTLLRQMELKDLTLNEAHEVQDWLSKELDRLRTELAQARKSLAWQFSRRQRSEQLYQEVDAHLDREIEGLETELEDIRGQHAYLEVISHSSKKGEPGELKAKKRRQKRVNPSELQLSLF